ncbi:MAG: Trehalose transport system permease protein SugB [Anaerolineae bacterium]|nr:Trehalose transport system permease protein SugB [Anaerolineae bacterium]
MTRRRQIISQVIALFILAIVLFPVLWIISMALDPRDVARPSSLIPAGASFQAFQKIFEKPTPNPVTFPTLLRNSALLAVGVSALTVLIGTTAAYAFSRFRFRGREAGMLGFILVLMLPSVATVAALFVMLNIVLGPQLRNSIFGVGVAMIAGALPFAIWNMKGFIDTIPKDLEEAALIDGASLNQTFVRIMLPLALPGLAVTALFGFMAGWTEFVLSWQFISDPQWFTLSMTLYGMQGQYASNTPWSQFAAMSIVVSIPILIVFFALQKYIVGGLTVGGVKG